MPKVQCLNGGWVFGTHVPFPMDPRVYLSNPDDSVPCNQLFCSNCKVPVKHMEGVKNIGRWPKDLPGMYASTDPDVWIDQVELKDEYRLYYCECSWYATPSAIQVGHLDTKDIDTWGCAGHPAP
jgi:hypothetical protein